MLGVSVRQRTEGPSHVASFMAAEKFPEPDAHPSEEHRKMLKKKKKVFFLGIPTLVF